MEALAVATTDLDLLGDLQCWRRITGVPRAHLATTPLLAWTHPVDIPELLRLRELATYRSAVTELRLGTWGAYVRCRLELGRWIGTRTDLVVEPLEPRPLSAWWLPESMWRALPPIPRTPQVMA